MPPLRCYRIAEHVSDSEDVLDSDAIDRWGVQHYAPIEVGGAILTLHLGRKEGSDPAWVPFLRSAFDVGSIVDDNVTPAAVLTVRLADQADELFAFTFGSGHHMLNRNNYARLWGLRVALNALCDPTSGAVRPLLKSIDVKRLATNTFKIRSQAGHDAAFESFDLAASRHIMRSVTGKPASDVGWTGTTSGGDSISFSADLGLQELGGLCRGFLELSDKDDYRREFGWIDNVRQVSDPRTVSLLEGRVAERIKSKSQDIELTVPEPIEWDQVGGMQFGFDRRGKVKSTRYDIRLMDYFLREDINQSSELIISKMKSDHVFVIGTADEELWRWRMWECLSGEVSLDGDTYVLDEGQFYLVGGDYLSELNGSVQALESTALDLPASKLTTREDEYLQKLCSEEGSYLLLDKELVTIHRGETRFEVCDVYQQDGTFLHAKRHFGSSQLSHLFDQGLVSAETIARNPEHRKRVASMLADLARKLGRTGHEASIAGLAGDDFRRQEYTVAYAIIGPWGAKRLTAGLPFFSKVALRRAAEELQFMGFRTICLRVEELRE